MFSKSFLTCSLTDLETKSFKFCGDNPSNPEAEPLNRATSIDSPAKCELQCYL